MTQEFKRDRRELSDIEQSKVEQSREIATESLEEITDVAKATQLRERTVRLIRRAESLLIEAHDAISTVEGEGSIDCYEELADAFSAINTLANKVEAIDPTGVFEI